MCIQVLIMAAILVGGMLAAWLISTPLERRRLKRAHEAFREGRWKLSDEDFLRQAKAGAASAELLLAARRAMAELCGVESELIHPQDTLRRLLDLQWDGGFLIDFVMEVEERAGIKCDWDRLPHDDTLPLADYVHRLAETIQSPQPDPRGK